MKYKVAFFVSILSVNSMFGVSSVYAEEDITKAKQPIAHALSKKINKEISICMESGTKNTHAFEQQKHLKMMMPDAYEKCKQGVNSACQMTASVLTAMEVTKK